MARTKRRSQMVMSSADVADLYAKLSSYTVGTGDQGFTVLRWFAGRAAVVATCATEREARARAIALQAA